MDNKKLQTVISEYGKKVAENKEVYLQEEKDRDDRIKYYKSFTRAKLLSAAPEEFAEYIGKLWSMRVWGNKDYIINKLNADNPEIRKQLGELLYGTGPVESRWDNFSNNVKGLGHAAISELLGYIYPDECIVLNRTTLISLGYLGVPNLPKYSYQFTGKKYTEICKICKGIAEELKKNDIAYNSLLAVDYFFWSDVMPLAEKNVPMNELVTEKKVGKKESKSLHDEIKEKLIKIGSTLGFVSREEIKVATGAKVDVVWEAQIGNMGKVIYVFEVQTAGSIDSLILNLQRARKNKAVQAVVAVSDEKQIAKILGECQDLIPDLKTWDYNDVMAVSDALERAYDSIYRLKLVPNSFD